MKMKRYFAYVAFIMIIGTTISCNKPSKNTVLEVTPEQTPTIEVVPTALPFVDDRQELIPIDEVHFEGDFLRVLLKTKFDLDGDGYLSKKEREGVEQIGFNLDFLGDEQMMEKVDDILEELRATSYETVFQYFPNLKEFVCPYGADIIVRNHDSLRSISHKAEDGTRDKIIVENCPNFMTAYAGDVRDLVSITEIPQGGVVIETNNLQPEYIFDGNLYVTAFAYSEERELSGFFDEADITWKNVKEQSIGYKKEDIEPILQGVVFDEFSYEVFDKVENIYDENGVKGWNICVDTKETVYGKQSFSLYCDKRPDAEDFKTWVNQVVQFSPLSYSPNRGVYGEVTLKLEVVYESDDEEQRIGTIEKKRFCFLSPDGSVQLYRTDAEWSIPEYDDKAYQIETPGVLDMYTYLEKCE